MKPILISPPFGNYIRSSFATRVMGSYTFYMRTGLFRKGLQFFYDNLFYPVPDGYRNRIGLRNRGLASLPYNLSPGRIYSIVGLEEYDWEAALDLLDMTQKSKLHLELNISCRNVHDYSIRPNVLAEYCEKFTITVKLSPDEKTIFSMAEMCAEAGVHYLHCSNTLPSDFGSLSGYPQKQVNLPLVEEMARRYPGIPIIGGGGIYTWKDLLDYRNAGAQYYSTSTIWFHPWKAHALLRQYYREEKSS